MNISGILAIKGSSVATIAPGATIGDAARELVSHGVGALVVSADGRTIVGILSERDLARGLASHGSPIIDLTVEELMTSEVVTCAPTDSVDHLMALMTSRRIRHVPVVEDGSLAGLVSIGDVVKSRLDDLETETQTLHEYISTGR